MNIIIFELKTEKLPISEIKNLYNLCINLVIYFYKILKIYYVKYYIIPNTIYFFLYIKKKKIKTEIIFTLQKNYNINKNLITNILLSKKYILPFNYLFIVITNKAIQIKKIITKENLHKKKILINNFKKILQNYQSRKNILFSTVYPKFPRQIINIKVYINFKNTKQNIYTNKKNNQTTIVKKINIIQTLQFRKELLRKKLLTINKVNNTHIYSNLLLYETAFNHNQIQLKLLKISTKIKIIFPEIYKLFLQQQKLLFITTNKKKIKYIYFITNFNKKYLNYEQKLYTKNLLYKYLNFLNFFKKIIKKNLEKKLIHKSKFFEISQKKDTLQEQIIRHLTIVNIISTYINNQQKNKFIFLTKYNNIKFLLNINNNEDKNLQYLNLKLYLQNCNQYLASNHITNKLFIKSIKCSIKILVCFIILLDYIIIHFMTTRKLKNKKDPFYFFKNLKYLILIFKKIKLNIKNKCFILKIKHLYKLKKKNSKILLKKIFEFLEKKIIPIRKFILNKIQLKQINIIKRITNLTRITKNNSKKKYKKSKNYVFSYIFYQKILFYLKKKNYNSIKKNKLTNIKIIKNYLNNIQIITSYKKKTKQEISFITKSKSILENL